MIRSALLAVALSLGLAACASENSPEPAPSPSPSPSIGLTEILAGEGITNDLVSHAFNDGVVQVVVRGARATIDERLRLCDRLADEFRDNPAVHQILVTAAPAAALVHWNAPDAHCTADRT
ncbi:hypothetical protein ACGFJ7_09715 [Actinoplanes sp. NPDC048988]|uniref:hypothetical protein n=1 Tax=Actinoplanes sp. NPDC048988 TaxID=3363901 RepID=UPI00371D6FBE